MPIYEYRCRKCAREFEAIVHARNAGAVCPDCGGGDLERLLSVFAVRSASGGERPPAPAGGGCGTCGDPRGPGSCATGWDD